MKFPSLPSFFFLLIILSLSQIIEFEGRIGPLNP